MQSLSDMKNSRGAHFLDKGYDALQVAHRMVGLIPCQVLGENDGDIAAAEVTAEDVGISRMEGGDCSDCRRQRAGRLAAPVQASAGLILIVLRERQRIIGLALGAGRNTERLVAPF